MARYLIHAMPKRMWYVNDYLVPSMLEQGIDDKNIEIYCDTAKIGNLRACMAAFAQVGDNDGGTWHLQDDVVISKNFKEQTELHDNGIVCGFASMYDGDTPAGFVPVKKMWFSFPCIRIPNKIAKGCSEWVLRYMIGNTVYKDWWEKGVNDDLLFRKYVAQECNTQVALNLAPNIVDHIDYLIGGSVNSEKKNMKQVRSLYWEDEASVRRLEKKLQNAVHR